MVLAHEAEAAIAAAEQRGWDKGYEAGRLDERAELRNHSVAATRAYEQGQADMLTKRIATVEALDDGGDTDTRYILASTAATLRSLEEKP